MAREPPVDDHLFILSAPMVSLFHSCIPNTHTQVGRMTTLGAKLSCTPDWQRSVAWIDIPRVENRTRSYSSYKHMSPGLVPRASVITFEFLASGGFLYISNGAVDTK